MYRYLVGAVMLLSCCRGAEGQASEYNAIYQDSNSHVFSREPNAFLVQMVQGRRPGKALDVGMGQGRNSIYLAEHGWDVTGFDPADAGVLAARAEAARRGVKLNAVVTTFEKFDFGEGQWDLIVLTYVPTKAIAPEVERALRPGGAVIVEDRHRDTRKVWPAGGLFASNELISLFPGLRVLQYEDSWGLGDWQAEGVHERLVRLFAEKQGVEEPGCLWKGEAVREGGSVCWQAVTFRCGGDGWQFTREKCAP